MPCRTDDWEPTVYKSESDKYKLQRDKYKKEADKATRLLCAALRTLQESYDKPAGEFVDKETVEWWEAHQDADEKRIQAEVKAAASRKKKAASAKRLAVLKKKGLDKLSTAEKAALGLRKK